MIPKFGGPVLPDAPDCLGGAHGEALRYARLVHAAIDQPGWSPRQRSRLRDLYRKWILRSEGRDPYFEQYGTFARFDGTPPPTATDLVVARWRKRNPRPSTETKRRSLPKHKRLDVRRQERIREQQEGDD